MYGCCACSKRLNGVFRLISRDRVARMYSLLLSYRFRKYLLLVFILFVALKLVLYVYSGSTWKAVSLRKNCKRIQSNANESLTAKEKEENRRRLDELLFPTLVLAAKKRKFKSDLNDEDYLCAVRTLFPGSTSDILSEGAEMQRPRGLSKITKPKDLLFIIMTSKAYTYRANMQRDSWLQWMDNNYIYFSDEEDAFMRVWTTPELKGKSSYLDAQHRQLKGAQWIMKHKPEMLAGRKWIIFVDDDTWMNVPALTNYLDHFDARMSLVIGFLYSGFDYPILRWRWKPFPMTLPTGSAGAVFSLEAFNTVVSAIYSPGCPKMSYNEGMWGYCGHVKGVTQVHCPLMYPYNVLINPKHVILGDYIDHISYHYMYFGFVNRKITCDVAEAWNAPIPSCA